MAEPRRFRLGVIGEDIRTCEQLVAEARRAEALGRHPGPLLHRLRGHRCASLLRPDALAAAAFAVLAGAAYLRLARFRS